MKYLEDDHLYSINSALSDATLGSSRAIYGRVEAFTTKRTNREKKYSHSLNERFLADIQQEQSEIDRLLGRKQEQVEESSREDQKGPRALRKRSLSVGGVQQLNQLNKKQQLRRGRSNSYDTSKLLSMSKSIKATALGDWNESGTRRLMTDMILTLNASFPDYDFAGTKPTDFERNSVSKTIISVNERLSSLSSLHNNENFLSQLWTAIDNVVRLERCEVYTYQPKVQDEDEDPYCFLRQTLIHQNEGEDEMSDDVESSVVNDTGVLWSFNYFFVNRQYKRIVFFTCIETMRQAVPIMEDTALVNDATDSGSMADRHKGEFAQKFIVIPADDDAAADAANFDLDPASSIAGGEAISTI